MRRLLTLSVLLLALGAGSAFAQQFSSLEERMSEAEFKAAGLDKLSAEELAALNRWLAGRVATGSVAGGSAAGPAEDRRGFYTRSDDAGEGDTIVTSFTGTFRGWRGKGFQFKLDNGQVWELIDSASSLSVEVENPKVFIEPGFLSAWYLRIEGYNTRAKVKRVK